MKLSLILKPDGDMIRKGYTLQFFSKKGGNIDLPDEKSEYLSKFEEGKFPRSLYGNLTQGGRLRGSFEGAWKRYTTDGLFEFSWSIAYNAPVLVVE